MEIYLREERVSCFSISISLSASLFWIDLHCSSLDCLNNTCIHSFCRRHGGLSVTDRYFTYNCIYIKSFRIALIEHE